MNVCFEKLNIVKMPLLPKLIQSFSTIPAKTQKVFLKRKCTKIKTEAIINLNIKAKTDDEK